ncbi:hypothetical protein QUB08_05895 [Microcoleus sp. BR0-C5]|uniref:hypothetical protein n=1 Tax=Microcoleus sp. BR0-C5 TaxID=2818713 RepID=UPI002FD6A06C
MKNLNLQTLKFDRNLEGHLDSPFIEKNGLLEFNPKFITPEFLTAWTFETHLYDEQVALRSTTLSSHSLAAPNSKTTPHLSAPSASKQLKAPTCSRLTFVRQTLTFPPICGCI